MAASPDFFSEFKTISKDPYRAECYIPCATVQVHASNLLLLPSKSLLCAWFGGSQEGCSDISIYISRLGPHSTHWTTPEKVSNDPERSEQNPVLFLNPHDSSIWLLYTSQPAGNQDKAIIKKQVSHDGGNTWSSPEQLFPTEGAFIRQPIVILKDGTWVLPTWYCRTPEGFKWNGNNDVSVVRYSRDGGITWEEKFVPNSVGCVHMNIRQLPDGTYISFFRSRWADNIYRSTSANGIDWTDPKPIPLPNPNSGICFDVLPNGRLAIVFNNSSAKTDMPRRIGLYDDITPADDTRENQPAAHGRTAFWGAPRSALSFGVSDDLGESWKFKALEDGDGYCMTNNSKEKINRELSYPSIAFDKDEGIIHLAYTFWRQRIKYVRLREDFAISQTQIT